MQAVEDDERPRPERRVKVPAGRGRQREDEQRRDPEDERPLPANEALLDHLDAGPVPEELVRAAEEIVREREAHDLDLGHLSPFFQGFLDGLLVLGALLREDVVRLLLQARHLRERAPGPDHERQVNEPEDHHADRQRDGPRQPDRPRRHPELLANDGLRRQEERRVVPERLLPRGGEHRIQEPHDEREPERRDPREREDRPGGDLVRALLQPRADGAPGSEQRGDDDDNPDRGRPERPPSRERGPPPERPEESEHRAAHEAPPSVLRRGAPARCTEARSRSVRTTSR